MQQLTNNFLIYENPQRFMPTVGENIENYKIVGQLGEGSFGAVFKVIDENGNIYALKLIKLWEIAYEKERRNFLERFIREFEISTLESQHLVKSFNYGKVLGNPFMVMEFCEGGSLKLLVGKLKDLNTINQYAHSILLGLQDIHYKGYFHRDIKPENILLSRNGNVKLADFGIAGHKNSRLSAQNIFGHAKQVFGTWHYIAPEQSNNKIAFKALDAVADIFSFGVMMFELLTGEFPYPPYFINSESDLVIYNENRKKGLWTNLDNKKQLLPGNWYSIIKGCLEPDYKTKRFQNVSALINILGFKSIDKVQQIYDPTTNDLILQISYGEEPNKLYNLTNLLGRENKDGILTLGRMDSSSKNDIEIVETQSTYISRRHATIEKWSSPDCWIIRDGQWNNGKWNASMNNLYLNSKPVSESGEILNPGDVITLGDTVILVAVL